MSAARGGQGQRGGSGTPASGRRGQRGGGGSDTAASGAAISGGGKPNPPGRRSSRRLLIGGAAALVLLGLVVYFVFLRDTSRYRGATGDASVLLITVDALRADRLGAYGYRQIRTPVLDALAGEGVLFENAITAAVLSRPSHASILTGTYPPTHGVRDDKRYKLAQSALTLAEVLRSRGARTGAVIGSYALDSISGLDQGFESYDDALPVRRLHETFQTERSAASVTDAALRFLRRAARARFFLWAHYVDPRWPHIAPASFLEQHPRRGYDAEVAYLDAEIGRLLDALREMGIRGRTLVVMSGSHGEGLGTHKELSHGVFLYEESSRVPLIISFPPHIPAGRRVKAVVRTVDILPTVLELTRIDPEQAARPAQGVSLWPLMTDTKKPPPERAAYVEAMAPALLYGWSPLVSTRDQRYKYIEAPSPELYDLTADPGERRNLAASRLDLAGGFRARLEALKLQVGRAGAVAEMVYPDAEAEARLRQTSLPDPKDKLTALSRIEQAHAAFGSGRYEAATQEATAILDEDPGSDPVRSLRAAALLMLGRCPEALPDLRALLSRAPDDIETLSLLGWCQIEQVQPQEATASFRRVLEIAPDNIPAMASLAEISFLKRDYPEASRQYKEVLRLEPYHIPSIKTMAGMFEGTGKLSEAEVFYSHGLEVDPRDVEMWMNLGWARFRQQKHEEALAAIEKARTLAPQAAELHVAAGDVLMALGRLDEARAAYSEAAKLSPRLAGAYYGLSLIEGQQGDPGKSLSLIRTAVSLNPDRIAWREDLGRALARTGRYSDAAVELERFLASGQAPSERRDELRREIEKYRRQGG